MTSISSYFYDHPANPKQVLDMNRNVLFNTLLNHKVLPWKYVYYHTLAEVLDIYKPERLFNSRLRFISSLVDDVYKSPYFYDMSKENVNVVISLPLTTK